MLRIERSAADTHGEGLDLSVRAYCGWSSSVSPTSSPCSRVSISNSRRLTACFSRWVIISRRRDSVIGVEISCLRAGIAPPFNEEKNGLQLFSHSPRVREESYATRDRTKSVTAAPLRLRSRRAPLRANKIGRASCRERV